MRIAIISSCQGYTWAGSEENWAWFADAALAAGHELMLGASHQICGSSRVADLRRRGLRVAAQTPRRPMRLYLLKERLRPDLQALLDFKPEAVLLNAGSPLDFCHLPYLQQFCARLKMPKVMLLTFNSDLLSFQPRAELESFFDELRAIAFVSEQNRRQLALQLARPIPNSRVFLNKSRLRLNAPLPMPQADALGVRLACVARLEVLWKGHDLLFDVLRSKPWTDRAWTLRLYGVGPDEAHLRQLATHCGLADRVQFLGWVPDVVDMWQENHLLVLPSRGEGLPLSALEAMMCGRPSVLMPVGGNAEIIDHGLNGFLAEAVSAPALGRALEAAWSAQSQWAEIGQAAHATAVRITSQDPGKALLDYLVTSVSTRPDGHQSTRPSAPAS